MADPKTPAEIAAEAAFLAKTTPPAAGDAGTQHVTLSNSTETISMAAKLSEQYTENVTKLNKQVETLTTEKLSSDKLLAEAKVTIEKLTADNKTMTAALAAIKKAEVDQTVGTIVEKRLSKGLIVEADTEPMKVSLSQLPIDQLKILLGDIEKIGEKIPNVAKPKASITQLGANDEDGLRMEMFGHKEKL
jgi:septal ring factor EnvC (AmiA/AmiB activator)